MIQNKPSAKKGRKVSRRKIEVKFVKGDSPFIDPFKHSFTPSKKTDDYYTMKE